MASASGDRYSIRIGGDAAGPVVAGNENRVEVHQSEPATSADGARAGEQEPAAPSQTNTAKDHSSLYTVMNGEMHIHRDASPQAPATTQEE
ncbi:hypothetical protein HUT18_30425 [Streptomyces sp. NA04227]|uniref:hypothetical protein n=1 Tax=Streptomyces sp. NA04227 TaxID=2742136 RepID=UPI0015900EE1|nr:hypothetical protein [Streptomyces sp. NA04227]QKW10096.1 hypothetical protein HUT18_30425 [Streptomyces sp. NA04227]